MVAWSIASDHSYAITCHADNRISGGLGTSNLAIHNVPRVHVTKKKYSHIDKIKKQVGIYIFSPLSSNEIN